MLTKDQAYDAMLVFLEAYWERGLKESDDLASLLTACSRLGDGRSLDPAQLGDWEAAVAIVRGRTVN